MNPISEVAIPMGSAPSQSDIKAIVAIVARARDAEVVLLGESSHGTKEYYDIRAEISKALILDDLNVDNVIVLESDFPSTYNTHRFTSLDSSKDQPSSVLESLDVQRRTANRMSLASTSIVPTPRKHWHLWAPCKSDS